MTNRNELQSWSNISATPASFTLRGGLYGVTVNTINWTSFAFGTLAFATNASDADTVTLGSTTYRIKDNLGSANDVKRESTAAATLLHLVKTINGTGTAGVDYFAGTTTPNASASAVVSTTNMVATARTSGSGGNSITSTEALTPVGDTWTAATLGDGGTAGSATLQRRTPDGSTFITCLTAFSANGYQSVYLPSGTYQLTIATASNLYADVVGIESPV